MYLTAFLVYIVFNCIISKIELICILLYAIVVSADEEGEFAFMPDYTI